MWWLLVEYDDEYETQGWKGFADEAAVSEFADNVNVGEPLKIPPVSLSPEESATVVSEKGVAGSTVGGVGVGGKGTPDGAARASLIALGQISSISTLATHAQKES